MGLDVNRAALGVGSGADMFVLLSQAGAASRHLSQLALLQSLQGVGMSRRTAMGVLRREKDEREAMMQSEAGGNSSILDGDGEQEEVMGLRFLLGIFLAKKWLC